MKDLVKIIVNRKIAIMAIIINGVIMDITIMTIMIDGDKINKIKQVI